MTSLNLVNLDQTNQTSQINLNFKTLGQRGQSQVSEQLWLEGKTTITDATY